MLHRGDNRCGADELHSLHQRREITHVRFVSGALGVLSLKEKSFKLMFSSQSLRETRSSEQPEGKIIIMEIETKAKELFGLSYDELCDPDKKHVRNAIKNKQLNMKRKCNYPNCKKKADVIEPFNSMGASDAYCKEHSERRGKS